MNGTNSPPKHSITMLLRSRDAGHSIHRVFEPIYQAINEGSKREFRISKLELPYISNSLKGVLRNALAYYSIRADVIHITGDATYLALLPRTGKVVVTIHDVGLQDKLAGVKWLIYRFLWITLPCLLASSITTISRQSALRISDIVPQVRGDIRLIPNPLHPSFRSTGDKGKRGRLLIIGTGKQKNIERCLAAVVGLDIHLDIVGTLSSGTIDLLRSHRISYSSRQNLTKAQIVEAYNQAFIVLFPSLHEGFGLPIIEGQAMARPIITSDLEPMRSVAGIDGALLVNPLSVQSIRRAVVTLLTSDDVYERLVASGLNNAKKYSLSEVAAQYYEVYNELV